MKKVKENEKQRTSERANKQGKSYGKHDKDQYHVWMAMYLLLFLQHCKCIDKRVIEIPKLRFWRCELLWKCKLIWQKYKADF